MQPIYPIDDIKINNIKFYQINKGNSIVKRNKTTPKDSYSNNRATHGVVITKGSTRVLGRTSNIMATRGVTNDKLVLGYSIEYTLIDNNCSI